MNGTILTCDGPDHKGEVIDHVTRTCLETLQPHARPPMTACVRSHPHIISSSSMKDTGFMSRNSIEGDEALALLAGRRARSDGRFLPGQPGTTRALCSRTAKRPGRQLRGRRHLHRRRLHPAKRRRSAVGLSLVKFGALTLPEFVLKTSVNPARHLRLARPRTPHPRARPPTSPLFDLRAPEGGRNDRGRQDRDEDRARSRAAARPSSRRPQASSTLASSGLQRSRWISRRPSLNASTCDIYRALKAAAALKHRRPDDGSLICRPAFYCPGASIDRPGVHAPRASRSIANKYWTWCGQTPDNKTTDMRHARACSARRDRAARTNDSPPCARRSCTTALKGAPP